MTQEFELIDNTEKNRYEFHIGTEVPRVEYIKTRDKIYLTHTEVPPSLAGRGIGAKLIGLVLEDIKEKGLTLVPLCPFVALYLQRNPQWKQLVLKGIKIG